MNVESKEYHRGYAAGRRRLVADIDRERVNQDRTLFRDAVFLSALNFSMTQVDWYITTKNSKKYITTLQDRVALAWDIADEAMKRK